MSLRISKYILPDTEVENFNFTFIPDIQKISPKYKKGRKVKATYLDENNKVVVEKVFKDVKRHQKLVAISMTINWYNEDNTIGLSKKQIIKNLNVGEATTELRKRRSRIIDYLTASSEGTEIEPYVDALLKRYKTEVDLFIYNNTKDFENRINMESNPTYLAYLAIVIEVPSEKYPNGKTVKDSILEQITQ